MPNSPPSSNLRTEVRAFLASVVPNAQLTDAAVNSEHQPLLLMRTQHAMAVFAFANGDMRNSYETLYGSFKNYYTEQKGHWDALDLAFVFCVEPGAPQLDQFCSNVETDVYFCRKFVVPLATPLGPSWRASRFCRSHRYTAGPSGRLPPKRFSSIVACRLFSRNFWWSSTSAARRAS